MLLALALTGCETMPDRDPEFAPVSPELLKPQVKRTGSIYQSSSNINLFEDQIAHRIGDIVIVIFDEQIKAKKDANIKVSKDADVSVTVPKLYGMDASSFLNKSLENEIQAAREMQGKGKTDQSNSLTGSISVSVVEVHPNGNLRVRGEKRVSLNQGNEYIRVSGIIRRIDITPSNQVYSSQLADATIMYTGDGAVADASRMGWFSRIFMSWLFPF